MLYRKTTAEDISFWRNVAKSVGGIMRCPNMDDDSAFLDYARRKLTQGNAVLAYDDEKNACAGFVGFSEHNNSITWLGVHEDYRGRGIGDTLLAKALCRLDGGRRITVNTYPDSYAPGLPARKLYFKHGFVETSGEVFVYEGYEMVQLHIEPTVKGLG